MKPSFRLQSFLAIAGSSLLAITSANAQSTLTWDAGGGGGAITNGGGAWLGANLWNNGGAAATWASGDNAIFAGPATAGGAVTLASPTTVGTLTFSPSFTGTYTLGTAGQALTINSGITLNASSGAATIISPITLGGSQTWTNNSTGALATGSVANRIDTNGNNLTFDGTGVFNLGIGNSANVTLIGSGNLIKNGSGRVNSGGDNTGFSGTVTINDGVLQMYNSATALGNGNLTLNGGVLSGYWGFTYTRSLGTGNNQVQILGGESGFAGAGTNGPTFNLGASVIWGASGEGSATGFFNPTKFVLADEGTGNVAVTTFSSGIDLNAATRTIIVPKGLSASGNSSTISGAITTSSGTAGLIKEGEGTLILSNAGNTYNGSTTISAGILQANSTSALGNSSATNTLIFNGGTLRAGGTITSAATRAVTMTQTGTIDTNNQAVSIAGDIDGAGGLTKNGANTLTLSGTNNYGGVTTVNAGTLAITKEAALASNTAANLNVKSGATLQLNVDSAGTAGFTNTNLNTLLGNISVANTAAEGLQSGVTLAFDTSTATGATFTPSAAITNSTGTFGGAIGLAKLGAGTLVLDQANIYTGATTITGGTLQLGSGGTGGSLSTNGPISVASGATFAVNQSDTVTQGTDFGSNISGAGGLSNVGAGTLVLNTPTFHTANTTATAGNITLSNARAIQFSALNTTGAGSVTLSGTGATTPIFAGLANSGTTRNLASVIDGSYASVTNLTLNPQSGSTFTYGGVIADGATGMDLTKTGAGTQTLQVANTYTGETYLNAGTLNLSGAAGALTGTTGITYNGGGLTLTNADNDTEDGLNRVNDSAPITSNGGTITYSNTTAGSTRTFIETLGSVALNRGQLNLVNTLDKTAGSQTLALSGLTRTGATNTSAITFSNAGGLNLTNDRIRVNGITTDTAAGEIIGAWATVGTAANAQTDYAVYDSDDTDGYVVARNTAGSAQTTWSTDYTTGTGTLNNTLANAAGSVSDGVLSSTRIINTLRNATTAASATANSTSEYFTLAGNSFANGDLITASGTAGTAAGVLYYVINAGGAGAGTFQISTTPGGSAVNLTNTTAGQIASGGLNLNGNNLGTYGVLNGAATQFNIAPGTGGVLTTPTGGGNLYLTTHGVGTSTQGAHHGISVTAPINNNGSDAVTLVKSGVGVLQLNATSNYTGGTVLNSGTLWAQSDASLGDVNGDITFNGSATLLLSASNGIGVGTSVALPSTRSIMVNEGAMATIAGGRAGGTVTVNGDISGSGGLTTGRVTLLSDGGVGTVYNFDLLGNNTFTGEFGVGTGLEASAGGQLGGVTINSLADSTSPITLNYGSGAFFSLGSTATANLSVTNRLVDLRNSNITIRNQDADNTMTFGAVSTTTTGAKTLTLGAGGAGGIIAGNITDGAGTIGVTKTAGTWKLSGTNTYSGQTSFSGSGAELNLVGSQAASPNTTFLMNTSDSTASSTIRFLDNTGGVNGGTATFGGRYRLRSNNTAGITNNFFVGNDSTANGGIGSGTTTGSTMIIGTMDWLSVANNTPNVGNIAIQGNNGYRLQINDVIMFNGSGHTAGNTNNTNFNPTTANVTLGNVTMATGNAVNGVIPYLVLNGTSSDNRITGIISNASDVGTSLRPVNLTKSNTSTWTLQGANTYAGSTAVSGGTLEIGGSGSLGSGSYSNTVSITGAGTTLRFNSTANQTLSGVVSGVDATAFLVKNNTGTLNLTNTNTFNGTTTISGGILELSGTGSINSSEVTINGGNFRNNSSNNYTGALTFTSGTISGTNWNGGLSGQIIGLGKTIAPGNSPGIAETVNQTWASGGIYEWEINSTLSGAGNDPGWDLISGTGALTITATAGNEFNINITSLTLGNMSGEVSDFNDASSNAWLIADFDSISGFDATDFILETSAFDNLFTGTFGITLGTGSGVLGADDTQIYLTYTAIPEPAAALLGSLGGLLLLRRRRAA